MATDASAAGNLLDIVIKNPHLSETEFQNFSVRVPLTTSVKALKSILRERYPTAPTESAQTLIHAGRVAKNESMLRDVISRVRRASCLLLLLQMALCMGERNFHSLTGLRTVLAGVHVQQQHHGEGPKTFHLIVKGMAAAAMAASAKPVN